MRNPTKHTRYLNKLLTLFAFIALFSFWSKPANAQMHGGVSFQVFYDELMPYGTWVNDPRHGFVWLPNAGPNFHPYATNGHWVVTSYGNTWVSDFNWGWAPFHYGRWYFSNHYGWAWVPGYEWGPAWVNWRTGGGYYGWAPLGPGIHINMAVNIPHHHYVFVPQRRLVHRRMNRYFVARPHVVNVYQNTTIINNTVVHNQRTYIAGPNRGELQRVSGRNIPVHQVSNANRPGRAAVGRGTVAMYRPEVNRNTVNQARPGRAVAPSEVSRNNNNRAATNTRQPQQRVNRSNGNVQRNDRSVQRNNARQEQVRSRQNSPSSRVEAQPSQRTNQRQVQQQPNQRQVQQQPSQRQVQQGPAQRQERQVQQRPAQSQTRQAAPRQEVRSSAPKVNQSRQQAPARTSSPRVQSSPSSRSNSGTVRSSPSTRSSGGSVSQPSSRGGNREGNSRGGGKRGNN